MHGATTLPKVLGFVWCTLSYYLFPKAMDNHPEKYSSIYRYCKTMKRSHDKSPATSSPQGQNIEDVN